MKEIDESEFGCPLANTHVMWYYDTHLQHHKMQGFKAVFAFVDHVPDMAGKTAAIEPDTRKYILGVSSDGAADSDDQVQKQLKQVLAHGGEVWSRCV